MSSMTLHTTSETGKPVISTFNLGFFLIDKIRVTLASLQLRLSIIVKVLIQAVSGQLGI